MIEEAFEYKIDGEVLHELWPNYKNDEKKLLQHIGTNIRQANIALNNIMTQAEKECLEEAYFGNNGWYKSINDMGMIRIKLAAMALGLTNNVFTFDPDKEDIILSKLQHFTKQDQLLMMSCYVKQKTVTYLTLKKYLTDIRKTNQMSIKLYRGINSPYNEEIYKFCGMESWTTNINIAYRFARNEGFIIEKDYPITRIFAGKRSTFKNRQNNLYINNGFFVNREHEMIVENFENEYSDINVKNIKFSIDNDIF